MKASLTVVSKLTKNIPAEYYSHAGDITRNPVYITFSRDFQQILGLLKHRNKKNKMKLFVINFSANRIIIELYLFSVQIHCWLYGGISKNV